MRPRSPRYIPSAGNGSTHQRPCLIDDPDAWLDWAIEVIRSDSGRLTPDQQSRLALWILKQRRKRFAPWKL